MSHPYHENRKPCAGTCGRDTRSTRYTAEQVPGTVVRVTADLCAKCARVKVESEQTEEERAALAAEAAAQKEAGYAAAARAHELFLAQREARRTARLDREARLGRIRISA